jgi:hypothetical protein
MAFHCSKIGSIFGLIGSVILMIAGLFGITISRSYIFAYPGFNFFVPYITVLVTIALSACGITGSVLVLRDLQWGYALVLGAGLIGIVASFIPIYTYDTGYDHFIYLYLSGTAMYGDLAVMVVGSVIGFALAEKKERNEF